MATEVEKKATEQEENAVPEKKKFMEIPEFRMLAYVLPVALVLLVLALILGK